MLLMVRAASPLLVSVMVRTALVVLTCWCPKLKLVGLGLTAGADAVVPFTMNLTDPARGGAWMIRTSAVLSAETGATSPPHIKHKARTAAISARRSIKCCQKWASFT